MTAEYRFPKSVSEDDREAIRDGLGMRIPDTVLCMLKGKVRQIKFQVRYATYDRFSNSVRTGPYDWDVLWIPNGPDARREVQDWIEYLENLRIDWAKRLRLLTCARMTHKEFMRECRKGLPASAVSLPLTTSAGSSPSRFRR